VLLLWPEAHCRNKATRSFRRANFQGYYVTEGIQDRPHFTISPDSLVESSAPMPILPDSSAQWLCQSSAKIRTETLIAEPKSGVVE